MATTITSTQLRTELAGLLVAAELTDTDNRLAKLDKVDATTREHWRSKLAGLKVPAHVTNPRKVAQRLASRHAWFVLSASPKRVQAMAFRALVNHCKRHGLNLAEMI